MNKLVLGSLLLATLATGCIISSSDDTVDQATIHADWSFHTVNPQGALSPNNPCPSGFNTAALHEQEIDVNGRPIGAEIIDLFDCVAMTDFSDPLAPSVYETQIWITSDGGGSVYAKSIPVDVDVTVDDKNYSASIVDNGGYFEAAWDLRKAATNAPVTCAGLGGVEISATITGSATSIFDTYNCDLGFAVSDPLIAGNYLVEVSALNSADGKITSKQFNNETIGNRNQVTDLGAVQLLIP